MMKFFITAIFFSMFSSFFTQGMGNICGSESKTTQAENNKKYMQKNSIIQEESSERNKIYTNERFDFQTLWARILWTMPKIMQLQIDQVNQP